MPATTPCRQGDVLLVDVAFTDGSGVKRRPVTVISTDEYHSACADAVVIPLTSRSGSPLRLGDYRIVNWRSAGLLMPSVAKGKPATFARSRIVRKLGTLTSDDLEGVLSGVKAILG